MQQLLLMPKVWECPGEAHDMDCRFNPGSQGPYGDGYHHCDVCENEYMISKPVYDAEIAQQKAVKLAMARRKKRLEEEREQQKLIDRINEFPRSNVPMAE